MKKMFIIFNFAPIKNNDMTRKIIYFLPLMMLVSACNHKSTKVEDSSVVAGYSDASVQDNPFKPQPLPLVKGEVKIPMATAFRMSGDYSDNVAVSLDNEGNLSYFPAPTDITADSRPISLGDGWWLNNQGFGQNTVFTKYTFAQYAELPEVPSVEQLKKDIIPGARVTEMKVLPFDINSVQNHIEEAKVYLKEN